MEFENFTRVKSDTYRFRRTVILYRKIDPTRLATVYGINPLHM